MTSAYFELFVGVDCGSQTHVFCVLDREGEILVEGQVDRSGRGLANFAERLTKLSDGRMERVAVSVEAPRGALVETLLERECGVFAINPKQLDRFRDRYTAAGAKDDRRDAYVLADTVRSDRRSYRKVRLDDPLVVELREVSREYDELRGDFGRTVNRLREQLHRYYAQLLELSPAANEVWIWDLLEAAPTPWEAKSLTPTRVRRTLKRRRIRRLTAPEVIKVLRAPDLRVAPGVVQASSSHALRLVKRARFLHEQQEEVQHRIDQLLEELQRPNEEPGAKREHRDAEILLSLPGVGKIVAATLLTEASQALEERNYQVLRTQAGIAPVTRASGKSRQIVMRRACSDRLRFALYHWSRMAARHDAPAKEHYAKLRARGHSHGRALRGVGDRLLRVLMGMLKRKSLYDAAQLRGAA